MSSLNILGITGINTYKTKIGEKYMNLSQIKHFKTILNTWYNKLKKKIKKQVYCIKKETDNLADPIDRASREEEFKLELYNKKRERELIKKIEITINKIENNSFGYCELCKIEIGIKRLEANPIANLCIDCKILSEIREKQIRQN
ncbi:RNA polymerase-binding protein DksA [Candidatus Purcelliella pentastirinorum]|uniref:RNA polymerase-binding protein DksA n=1 Tax=Candidatus Purcelliella pentastirinorum TaxID=472834 RepID=A0AAX3N8N0_9ENTR|nr:RNA polymerase-binding protein DksA [Candidatus Purcelliella pentastirinorum]WDI78743.1 RNA polymerase-binding protein DksA [Candidatus Purcelliella pentastirinorum]WDR80739.1 RNA polymerase-binding protein DksA [Candidatus Purcelliella pentastirinorum]